MDEVFAKMAARLRAAGGSSQTVKFTVDFPEKQHNGYLGGPPPHFHNVPFTHPAKVYSKLDRPTSIPEGDPNKPPEECPKLIFDKDEALKNSKGMTIKEMKKDILENGGSLIGVTEKQDLIDIYVACKKKAARALFLANKIIWHFSYGSLECQIHLGSLGTYLDISLASEGDDDEADLKKHHVLFIYDNQQFGVSWSGFQDSQPLTIAHNRASKRELRSLQDEPIFFESQRQYVSRRALHRILRGHKNKLICSYDFLRLATDWLANNYQMFNLPKLSLDARVIAVDGLHMRALMYPAEMTWQSVQAIGFLAGAVEGRGRFKLAAQMYLDVAENKTIILDEFTSPQDAFGMFFNNAGVAFRRATEYCQAEECYIAYLSCIISKEKSRHLPFGNLCRLFEERRAEDDRPRIPPKDMAEPSFYALLLVSDYKYDNNVDEHFQHILKLRGQQYLPRLKPEFQSKEAAIQALREASTFPVMFSTAGTGTKIVLERKQAANHFRSKLHSCWQEGMSDTLAWDLLAGRPQSEKDSKEMARELQKSETKVFCFSPNCKSNFLISQRHESSKYMYCSACGQVMYCSKNCQIDHWKAGHKEECKILAANKSKMKSQRKGNKKSRRKVAEGEK